MVTEPEDDKAQHIARPWSENARKVISGAFEPIDMAHYHDPKYKKAQRDFIENHRGSE